MLFSWGGGWGRRGEGRGAGGLERNTEWMNVNEETQHLPNLLIGVSEVIPSSLPSLLKEF